MPASRPTHSNEKDPQHAQKRMAVSTQAGSPSMSLSQRHVLNLQRHVGNRAVQRLLANPQASGVQRAVELDEAQVQVSEPEPANVPANAAGNNAAPPQNGQGQGGDGRMTRDEFLNQVTDATVIVSNPMIGFSVGDTFSGIPAKVQSVE